MTTNLNIMPAPDWSDEMRHGYDINVKLLKALPGYKAGDLIRCRVFVDADKINDIDYMKSHAEYHINKACSDALSHGWAIIDGWTNHDIQDGDLIDLLTENDTYTYLPGFLLSLAIIGIFILLLI